MATTFGSENALCAYTPSATGASKETSLTETSPMDGLKEAPTYQYKGIRSLQSCVKSHDAQLMDGRSNQQYLVFYRVTKDDLAEIDNKRARIGKHTRMTHYTDIDLLIVKLMPSAEHEIAHLTLSQEIVAALLRMGLRTTRFVPIGATKFSPPNSSKEGDSAYKPATRNRKYDWPTIVVESGLSEGLARLRIDAQWWLANSEGDVKIVVIISILPLQKKLHVEKWCLSPASTRPLTRAHPTPNPQVPTNMHTITITQNPAAPPNPGQPTITIQEGSFSYAITGAPLVLEFQNLFLRPSVPPEVDIIFTAADLSDWAHSFWKSLL